MMSEPDRRARAREAAGAVVQYGLLFGFAAVAAAISAHGLVGFARANMGLAGPWPYLLWGALDGAAGMCAVLLMRRAARGESALAPRVAVWVLIAASSVFNWTHAPPHPGAREAFALMPVIAAVLFEFSLRETRHTAARAGDRLVGVGWLRPAERLRIHARLAADPHLDAGEAARSVRAELAARQLHALRLALATHERPGGPGTRNPRHLRRIERRAQAALTRARFADPTVAADVLRHVQVLTLTPALARLDYTSPAAARALLASLITNPGTTRVSTGTGNAAIREGAQARPGAVSWPASTTGSAALDAGKSGQSVGAHPRSHPPGGPGDGASPSLTAFPRMAAADHLADVDGRSFLPGNGTANPHPAVSANGGAPAQVTGLEVSGRCTARSDRALVEAATQMVAQACADGDRISQASLARRLRSEGFHIANERLRWLAQVSGLEPGPGQAR
jgi:hypothetical protein